MEGTEVWDQKSSSLGYVTGLGSGRTSMGHLGGRAWRLEVRCYGWGEDSTELGTMGTSSFCLVWRSQEQETLGSQRQGHAPLCLSFHTSLGHVRWKQGPASPQKSSLRARVQLRFSPHLFPFGTGD